MRRLADLDPWCLDFEYWAPGDSVSRVRPICVSGVHYWTRQPISLWLWDDPPKAPPFHIGPNTAMCSYAAQAEASCFIALGWELPRFTIDVFAEFRVHTNGRRPDGTNGLLYALAHYGISTVTSQEKKDQMRDLCKKGGPFSEAQKAEIMAYCDEDAVALADLVAALEADHRGGSND